MKHGPQMEIRQQLSTAENVRSEDCGLDAWELEIRPPGDARVWCASIGEVFRLRNGRACLSEQERLAAGGLLPDLNADQFSAARILLRNALSLTQPWISPGEWRFKTDENGKPRIDLAGSRIEFSLAHAGESVAVAICSSGSIGVDVEALDSDLTSDIVHDVLSERERSFLQQVPEGKRWETFLELWTLKEATAKALGLGVLIEFRRIEVSLDPPGVLEISDLAGDRRFDAATAIIRAGGRPYRLSLVKASEGRSDET